MEWIKPVGVSKYHIKKFWNWLHLPPKCPIHGRSHLFQRNNGKWECKHCFREMLNKAN